jgi:hypothetical protein
MSVLIGVDVGQMVDFSALAVVERIQPELPRHPHEVAPDDKRSLQELTQRPLARYVVRHLQRFPLHTSYPDMVNRVVTLFHQPEVERQQRTLLVDATGVGRGITDMFKVANVPLKAITIHGGFRTTSEGNEWHVPKRELVGALRKLSQERPVRLALGERLPFIQEIMAEMETFVAKINPDTGHESFLQWREQEHDDLILSLAMACWYGEYWGDKKTRVWNYLG